MTQRNVCKLALADGLVLTGESFGATGTSEGEVVFNTGLMGYQEVLTDPSYTGQIVTMTYPLIGNYGVNTEDIEARNGKVQVRAFVIKELSPVVSSFRANSSLHDYLAAEGVIGICNVDTRALTKRLRTAGAMSGIISTEILDDVELVKRAAAIESMAGSDFVKDVRPEAGYDWAEGYNSEFAQAHRAHGEKTYKVVAIDCGAKVNILRNLVECGCDLQVVPATATAEEILAMEPDGVFVSNGPGDPSAVEYTVETLKGLIGKVPMFGICLGHQMLSLALGAKTYKLKFGHRGCNHPVRNEATGKVEITSQNHGFAVDLESLGEDAVELTHINLNDNTLEGLRHRELPVFCVQYHPEASAGPHDSEYLFDEFSRLMDTGR